MFKTKYKYNPKTLQYEPVRRGPKYILKKSLPILIISAVFGGLFLLVYLTAFNSPIENKLRTNNKFLKSQIKQINKELDKVDKKLLEIAKQDNNIYRTIYEMDSIPSKVRNSGYGGTDRYADLKAYDNSELIINTARRIDKLSKKLKIQKNSFREISEILKKESIRKQNLPVIQPIYNNDLTRIGSYYGMRLHPILGYYRMHKGIDLTAPRGTPIYASGGGKVVRVEHSRRSHGYGNLVVIDHGVDGLSTRYGHLYSINVKEGQKVKRGQKIGTVGSTGLSTSPHLHYEIRKNGKTINPLYYYIDIEPEKYDILIERAKLPGKSFD